MAFALRILLGSVAASAVLSCTADRPAVAQNRDERGSAIALSWSRDGGIAGFCDTLQVAAAGDVMAKSCKTPGERTRKLASDEAQRLDQLRRRFATVTVTSSDEATADAMKQTLTLAGTGTAQPSETERHELLDFAHSIYTNTLK